MPPSRRWPVASASSIRTRRSRLRPGLMWPRPRLRNRPRARRTRCTAAASRRRPRALPPEATDGRCRRPAPPQRADASAERRGRDARCNAEAADGRYGRDAATERSLAEAEAALAEAEAAELARATDEAAADAQDEAVLDLIADGDGRARSGRRRGDRRGDARRRESCASPRRWPWPSLDMAVSATEPRGTRAPACRAARRRSRLEDRAGSSRRSLATMATARTVQRRAPASPASVETAPAPAAEVSLGATIIASGLAEEAERSRQRSAGADPPHEPGREDRVLLVRRAYCPALCIHFLSDRPHSVIQLASGERAPKRSPPPVPHRDQHWSARWSALTSITDIGRIALPLELRGSPGAAFAEAGGVTVGMPPMRPRQSIDRTAPPATSAATRPVSARGGPEHHRVVALRRSAMPISQNAPKLANPGNAARSRWPSC